MLTEFIFKQNSNSLYRVVNTEAENSVRSERWGYNQPKTGHGQDEMSSYEHIRGWGLLLDCPQTS